MLWEIVHLNAQQLADTAAQEESHFLDFKDSRSIVKIEKTAAAFANADGGELYVGIGDHSEADRYVSLFSNLEQANQCVAQVMNMFNNGLEYVGCEFLSCDNKGYAALFTIQKTPFVVRTSAQKTYRRQNAQDRELTSPHDLTRLELEKGVQSFEDSIVDATEADLTHAKTMDMFLTNVVPASNLPVFLQKERLAKDGKLRACALVLFDDNPQSLLPHSAIKVYRYQTLAEEGDREDLVAQPITIEGCAYDIIHEAVAKTKEIVETIPKLSTSGFMAIKYPEEAIHEVICNAVLHRDYSLNDYVHVRIFDNRIEVESPGKLAGPVTIRNILTQRFARNKKIVRLIAKFPSPPNKDVGEGLNTTFRSMQKLNLGRPEITETASSVLVRLKHEPLASKEELIRRYLRDHDAINNTTARKVCNVDSDSVIRKLFKGMIDAGELEKIPETRGKGTKYRLPKK